MRFRAIRLHRYWRGCDERIFRKWNFKGPIPSIERKRRRCCFLYSEKMSYAFSRDDDENRIILLIVFIGGFSRLHLDVMIIVQRYGNNKSSVVRTITWYVPVIIDFYHCAPRLCSKVAKARESVRIKNSNTLKASQSYRDSSRFWKFSNKKVVKKNRLHFEKWNFRRIEASVKEGILSILTIRTVIRYRLSGLVVTDEFKRSAIETLQIQTWNWRTIQIIPHK